MGRGGVGDRVIDLSWSNGCRFCAMAFGKVGLRRFDGGVRSPIWASRYGKDQWEYPLCIVISVSTLNLPEPWTVSWWRWRQEKWWFGRWVMRWQVEDGRSAFCICFCIVGVWTTRFLLSSGSSSSGEDDDDEGMSAAAFLKKKEGAGDGRAKFLKKAEVRPGEEHLCTIFIAWTKTFNCQHLSKQFLLEGFWCRKSHCRTFQKASKSIIGYPWVLTEAKASFYWRILLFYST